MTNDSKADEPDMDEILTSIRRIISDGDFPQAGSGDGEPQEEDVKPVTRQGDDVLHLTEKIEDQAAYGPIPSAPEMPATSEESFVSELEALVQSGESASDDPTPADKPLFESAPNITESLEAIANLIGVKESHDAKVPSDAKSREAQFLEDLAAETLRREIKTWLDENLPGLVERLVREEIENLLRLAGNRR